MARVSLVAFMALIVIGISGAGALAVVDTQGTLAGVRCPAPAWDRTPIYVQQPNDVYQPPTVTVNAWRVDPWVKCGAFCAAGQIPVGWPYGWNAEYWLRPNTNF